MLTFVVCCCYVCVSADVVCLCCCIVTITVAVAVVVLLADSILVQVRSAKCRVGEWCGVQQADY